MIFFPRPTLSIISYSVATHYELAYAAAWWRGIKDTQLKKKIK